MMTMIGLFTRGKRGKSTMLTFFRFFLSGKESKLFAFCILQLGKEFGGNIDQYLFWRNCPLLAFRSSSCEKRENWRRRKGGGEIHFPLSLGLEGANNSSLVFQGCSLPHPIVSGDFRVESSMEVETRRVASVANRKIYFGAQLL